MTLVDRSEINIQLMELLMKLQGVIGKVPLNDKDNLDDLIIQLHDVIEKLDMMILPYTVITQFVYENQSHDLLYMIPPIQEKFGDYCGSEVTQNFHKFQKLIEHFELAQQQKNYLYKQQEEEINKIHERSKALDEQFREQQKKFDSQLKQLEKMEKKLSKLNTNVKGATSQFISILGIFAAILLGSFGAMQGFTSLFNNAQNMNIGKLLIISAVGASSVILILFFLMNSIAKLTGRSLASVKDSEASIILKYPILTISYGIIILITLIGTSLELSNVKIKFALQGFWWLLPFLWILYFVLAVNSKSLLLFKRKEIHENYDKHNNDISI